MVAQEYYFARIIGLSLTILCFFISSLQIYILLYHKIKVEIKYYIHYCCLSCIFFTLLTFIDPDGVYQLIPFVILNAIENLAAQSLATGFCFVIYSHFNAHYLSLKENMPSFLGYTLFSSIGIGTFLSTLGVILTYTIKQRRFYGIVNLQSILWIIVVVGVDLYAYYLVRTLVLNALQREATHYSNLHINRQPSSSNSSTPRFTAASHIKNNSSVSTNRSLDTTPSKTKNGSTNKVNYYLFLKRMRNFHLICVVLGLIFLITSFNDLLNNLSQGTNPPNYPTSDNFTFNLTVYGFLFLLVWLAFTWWSWVPLRIFTSSAEQNLESSKETHLSKSEQNFSNHSHENHNNHPHHLHDGITPPQHVRKVLLDMRNNGGTEEEERTSEQIEIITIQPQPQLNDSMIDDTPEQSNRTLVSDQSERTPL